MPEFKLVKREKAPDPLVEKLHFDPMVEGAGNQAAYRKFIATNPVGFHVFIDANDFGSISERWGHATGDEAMKAFGGALVRVAQGGRLFRVGGDEFHAWFPTQEHAVGFLRTARHELEQLPPVKGVHHHSFSAGVGASPEEARADALRAKHAKNAAGYAPGHAFTYVGTTPVEPEPEIPAHIRKPIQPGESPLALQTVGSVEPMPVAKAEDLDKAVLDPKAGYRIEHSTRKERSYYPDARGQLPVFTYTTVRAFSPGGEQVGSVDFGHDSDGLEVGAVNVHPDHRRRGIASAMYAHAEKATGLKVKPSKHQTEDGRALWAGNAQNPQFGKAEARPFVKKVLDPNAGYSISHQVQPPDREFPRGLVVVQARSPERGVGHVFFEPTEDGDLHPLTVQVHPAHRRRGVASAMYAHAEKVTGRKVVPSDKQEPDGQALWAGNAQNPQFGKAEEGGAYKARNKKNGRYTYHGDWDRLCECGAKLGNHTAVAPHDNDDTGCEGFRPAKTKKAEDPFFEDLARQAELRTMAVIHDDAQKPMTVWRVENDAGKGPYARGSRLSEEARDLVHSRSPVAAPDPHADFLDDDVDDWCQANPDGMKFGFQVPEDAERWFGPDALASMRRSGFTLRQVLARKVWRSQSARQVMFEPHAGK